MNNTEKKQDDKKKKVLPGKQADTNSPSPGSMSEGNLTNNRYGRTKGRTPHLKTTVTGSDDDGQTN